MSNALYFVADTLDVELVSNDQGVSGLAAKKLDFGPFEVPVKVVAISDVIGSVDVSAFTHVVGDLWLYTVVSGDKTTIYAVDGKVAGLTVDSARKFGGLSWRTTIKKLLEMKAVKAVFRYDGLRYNRVEASSPKQKEAANAVGGLDKDAEVPNA